MQQIEDEAVEWRGLAFAFGTLFANAQPVDDPERLVGLMVHDRRARAPTEAAARAAVRRRAARRA